jgi:DNA mismatch repair protein MutS2
MINPEICDLLAEKNRSFVPVSIALRRGATVITGANMGGKSVALKTVALNVLLLQAGFLPCAKQAKMPLFHSVKMLFDDLQSIQSGLSGFGSEIVEFQKALNEVEQGYSLFLLDEFARGTNPDEGALIVQAVTRYLEKTNAISILSTHYDKVAENAGAHYQIIGLRDIDPETIRSELKTTGDDGIEVIARHMNYGLYRVEGKSDCPRDALNICRMLSLKQEILASIEASYEN